MNNMDTVEINLIYLLKELKRHLVPILAVGVAFAVLFGAYAIVKKPVNEEVNYGSEAVMIVDYNDMIKVTSDKDRIYKPQSKDNSALATAIVTSDDVLESVIKDSQIETDIAELKKSVHVFPENYGDVVVIVVLDTNQETATTLCDAIARNALKAFNSRSIYGSISQKAHVLGEVQIEKIEDAYAEYENSYQVTTDIVAEPAESPFKKVVIGFVVGILLMCAFYCMMYIFRGVIIYAGEIEDLKLQLLGILGKDDEAALSDILMRDSSIKKIAVLRAGTDIDLSELKNAWDKHGVETIVTDDIIANPFEKDAVRSADTSVLVVETNTIKKADLLKTIDTISAAGTFSGVLFWGRG